MKHQTLTEVAMLLAAGLILWFAVGIMLTATGCHTTTAVVRRNVAPTGQDEKWQEFDRKEVLVGNLCLYSREAPRPRLPGPIERAVGQYRPAVKVGGWCGLVVGLLGILAAALCASNGTLAKLATWGVRCAIGGVGCWLLCLALTTVLELWVWILIGLAVAVAAWTIWEFSDYGFGRPKATTKQDGRVMAPDRKTTP